MPTYAYTCTECGHSFDIHQSFSDDTLTACPECGGKLRKLFSSVGVVFKGSGFYRNDARSGSDGRTSTTGGKSSDKDSTTTESTKSAPVSKESTPAATSSSTTASSSGSNSAGSGSGSGSSSAPAAS